ncbi:MAG: hypothetical protein J7L07_00050 [Candidatus Odinarchaeota archaeon]|nr:hypothetical protein [Candidatus Odinarchaeota archaeon]
MGERKKISELCSFIFGRQLLLVGYTIYDEDCNIVEEYACNPWGGDPRSLCLKPDIPPVRISGPDFCGKAEVIISQLLPSYCELRDSLRLNDALWLYWIARNMPDGINLPTLAAAVEAIMNGWFSSNRTRSRGVYMDKDEFERLLHEEIEAIQGKLEDKLYGDRVVNRIRDAYRMSVTDRFRFFFEEIDLVVDENEWKAIKARHAIAHGQIGNGKMEWRRLIQHSQTYETLIHKILLKVLGYSGSYVDRSTVGWKDKQLV